MLLESVLAEFSIDDLSDHRQQMLPVKTHAAVATQEQIYSRRSYSKSQEGYSLYTHRVVLEMYSPRESSCELLNNSGKLMKHMTHLSEEFYSYKAPPDFVPFRWPGVRKSVQREEELRQDQLMPPGARSASAAISPSSYSIRTSSVSLNENEDNFSWNLSHLPRESIDVFQSSLQEDNISDYEDEDIIPPSIELDAHKAHWIDKSHYQKAASLSADEGHPIHNSNMELTTMASRPARTASASLVWGVFPCCLGKCFGAPSVKQKEKSEQAVPVPIPTTNIEQGKVYCSSSHGLKMMLARHTLRARAKKLATRQGLLKHM